MTRPPAAIIGFGHERPGVHYLLTADNEHIPVGPDRPAWVVFEDPATTRPRPDLRFGTVCADATEDYRTLVELLVDGDGMAVQGVNLTGHTLTKGDRVAMEFVRPSALFVWGRVTA